MAGNIIPAIATTNAVIAGVVILKAFGILRDEIKTSPKVKQTNKTKKKPPLNSNFNIYRFIFTQDLVLLSNIMKVPILIVMFVNQEEELSRWTLKMLL